MMKIDYHCLSNVASIVPILLQMYIIFIYQNSNLSLSLSPTHPLKMELDISELDPSKTLTKEELEMVSLLMCFCLTLYNIFSLLTKPKFLLFPRLYGQQNTHQIYFKFSQINYVHFINYLV